MAKTNQEKINKSYNEKYSEAEELIARIQKAIEAEKASENKNWGHYGNIGHLKNELENMAEFYNC